MVARSLVAIDVAPQDGAACRLEYPCAPSQERFWFEDALHPGNPGLNVAVRWRLEGRVSTDDLNDAWRRIVARQAALRTFFSTRDSVPVQVVEPNVPFSVAVVDLRHLSPEEARAQAEMLASVEARTPFDLRIAPLLRVTRAIVSDEESMLLVTTHHAVCDGWSIGILAREMGALCSAIAEDRAPDLPALEISYGTYALRERARLEEESFGTELSFWRDTLADYVQFELPTDRPRPALQSSNGTIVSRLLPRALTDGLTALGRERGCTLFSTALSALFVLLHRHSSETDISLGTQVAGRDDDDVGDLVGCFINTLAVRANVGGDPRFVDLLERVRDHVMDVLEARRVPVEKLVEIVAPTRDLSRNALFSTNFIFQRSFIENARYGSFALVDCPSRSAGALYDLNFFMVERPDGWRASCEYNTDLFDEETVTGLLRRFEVLLEGIVADPTRTISDLPVLAPDDVATLEAWNATGRSYPAAPTVTQWFAAVAERSPSAHAVVANDRTLTYAQLDAASNRLAHALCAHGVAPGTRIGVFLDRSIDLVVALLGILKAGAAYVPLDPTFPTERIADIAQRSGLAAIAAQRALGERAVAIGVPLVTLDAADLARHPAETLGRTPAPEDVAYVIFTSGSTGRPKGVSIAHRSLVNLLAAMLESPGLDPSDTLVAVTTISFDIAALEIFLPLVVGARLVVATNDDATDGHRLRRVLERYDATVLQATPVTWRLLLEAGWRGRPALKMLCGGEALSRELATQLLACGDDLWNLYGPTETTIWSAVRRVDAGDGPVLVGSPIANTRFYVLDAGGRLAPPGVVGELFIGGDGVALGYFGRPDLTAERFVPDPFVSDRTARMYRTGDLVRRHGNALEFLGRTDQQIKLRGFRIELGEIEATLRRSPDVADAVAIVGKDSLGDDALWAYAVPTHPLAVNEDAWVAALRLRLAETLPSYMLPSPIVALAALPRTLNGKVDRRALPLPTAFDGDRVPADDAERTPTEATIAALLCELLGRSRIASDADIFGLGFHSLLAVRLVARIEAALSAAIPLRTIFDRPTVRQLASSIDAATLAPAHDAMPAAVTRYNGAGSSASFIYLHSDLFAEGLYCRKLAGSLGPSQPFVTLAPHGTAGLPILPSIEAMAADYYERIREIQPRGPYRLGGFCVSGLVAYELARRLRACGEVVEDVLMINSSALPSARLIWFDRLVRRIGLDARLSPRLREDLCYNLARMHAAVLGGPTSMARYVVDRIRSYSARRRDSLHAPGAEPQPFEKHAGERETENAFVHLVAALTYHPQPYDGPVTLIWSTDQETSSDGPAAEWRAVAPETRIASISGGHVSPLSDRIDEIGALLRSLLSPDARPSSARGERT